VPFSDGASLLCLDSPNGSEFVEPACEDGNVAVRDSGGYLSCDDGSEPACENESTPVLFSDGTSLLCVDAPSGSAFVEPVCEDGGVAERDIAGGPYACGDRSEPACEAGALELILSGSSAFACEVPPGEERRDAAAASLHSRLNHRQAARREGLVGGSRGRQPRAVEDRGFGREAQLGGGGQRPPLAF
jgi:hypothetical protein